jgi:hypothetical protein
VVHIPTFNLHDSKLNIVWFYACLHFCCSNPSLQVVVEDPCVYHISLSEIKAPEKLLFGQSGYYLFRLQFMNRYTYTPLLCSPVVYNGFFRTTFPYITKPAVRFTPAFLVRSHVPIQPLQTLFFASNEFPWNQKTWTKSTKTSGPCFKLYTNHTEISIGG